MNKDGARAWGSLILFIVAAWLLFTHLPWQTAAGIFALCWSTSLMSDIGRE